MKSSKQIVSDFLFHVIEDLRPEEILILSIKKPTVLLLNINGAKVIENEADLVNIGKNQYDLVIGDFPLRMQPKTQIETSTKIIVNKNWDLLLYSLRTLKPGGKAFCFIEPSFLYSLPGKKFLNEISYENFFVNAVFELPERFLYPEAMVQPILLYFERQKSENLFIGEITDENRNLQHSFSCRISTQNLAAGIILDRYSFESFSKFKIDNEINGLKTQYNDYNKYRLREVAEEINISKGIFTEKANAIYIPKTGSYSVVSSVKETTLKHQNYIQVVLNESIVKAEYLTLFYKSDLGKQVLKSLTSGDFIPTIKKIDLDSSFIPIPSLLEQDILILTNSKLTELQETIDLLKKELSLNPRNANILLEKFESIQSPLKKLSVEDEILGLIRKGENKHIEFKETFSKNIKTGQKDKEIEKSSLKNIVGFLNADGGKLIIGVSDDGKVTGIENDYFTTADKYKLNFKNALNSKIGPEFYSMIDYDLYFVSNRLVLRIDCQPSNVPCFYDQTEFFVRTNPATDKLEGKRQFEYIKERFK